MPYYAILTVVEADNVSMAHDTVVDAKRSFADHAAIVFVGEPWEVEPIPAPCPVCDAQGEDQSCIENGELIDDHFERGTPSESPEFGTLECFDQHRER